MSGLMKRLVVMCICLVSLLVMGCTPLVEPDKVLMDVQFELQPPEGLVIEQVNFVLDLRNVNTKENIHKGSIDKLAFQVPLIRGLYIIHIDGVALVKKDGKQERFRLRGYLENHLLLDTSETCVVPLYPMSNL